MQEAAAATRPVDRELTATALNNLAEAGMLQEWGLDDDDDYVIVQRDGQRRAMWADQTSAWATGVAHGVNLARADGAHASPRADPEELGPLLDLLVHHDVLSGWIVDEDGDYRLDSRTSGSEWVYNSDIASWLKGALHTFRAARTLSDDQRTTLREWFRYLRQVGPLDGWEADEIGEYRIWSGGDTDSLDVPGNLALAWAMGAVEATQWLGRQKGDEPT